MEVSESVQKTTVEGKEGLASIYKRKITNSVKETIQKMCAPCYPIPACSVTRTAHCSRQDIAEVQPLLLHSSQKLSWPTSE